MKAPLIPYLKVSQVEGDHKGRVFANTLHKKAVILTWPLNSAIFGQNLIFSHIYNPQALKKFAPLAVVLDDCLSDNLSFFLLLSLYVRVLRVLGVLRVLRVFRVKLIYHLQFF